MLRGAPQVFASETVSCVGQLLGIVVADTKAYADAAAALVHVTYTEELPPILSIEDAIAAGSYSLSLFSQDILVCTTRQEEESVI